MNKLKIEYFKNKKYSYQASVRVGDLNYGNHLAHDKLITIIHDARVCFFKGHQLSEINLENTYTILLSSLTIDYLGQGFLGDIINVHVFINEIKKTNFKMSYKVSIQNSTIALCSTTLVCYNNISRQPDKIPTVLLSVLNQ
jgi:acyl-CoA thioester hydrolase